MVFCGNKHQRVHVIRSVPYLSSTSLSSDHKEASHHRSHPRHTLDVFVPAEAYNPACGDANRPPSKLPVVLHCHGGGWMRGNSSSEWRGGPVFGRWAAQNNMIAVVINYRLSRSSWPAVFFRSTVLSLLLAGLSLLLPSPIFHEALSFPVAFVTVFCVCLLVAAVYSVVVTDHATHPHHVHDVAAAIRWVQDHLHEVCPLADTSSGIVLSGHSAGAHLVSLVSLDPSFLVQHGVQPGFIKGVVSVSGVYTLWAPLHRSESNFRNMFFRLFYARAAFGSDPTVWRAASPIQHVESRVKFVPPKAIGAAAPDGLPRFLVLNAAADLGLEIDGERFVASLKRNGFDVQYFTVPGTGHASIASKFHQHSAAKHVLDFLLSFEQPQARPVLAEFAENTPAA